MRTASLFGNFVVIVASYRLSDPVFVAAWVAYPHRSAHCGRLYFVLFYVCETVVYYERVLERNISGSFLDLGCIVAGFIAFPSDLDIGVNLDRRYERSSYRFPRS
jgi:hypothetical protein